MKVIRGNKEDNSKNTMSEGRKVLIFRQEKSTLSFYEHDEECNEGIRLATQRSSKSDMLHMLSDAESLKLAKWILKRKEKTWEEKYNESQRELKHYKDHFSDLLDYTESLLTKIKSSTHLNRISTFMGDINSFIKGLGLQYPESNKYNPCYIRWYLGLLKEHVDMKYIGYDRSFDHELNKVLREDKEYLDEQKRKGEKQ